MAVNLLIAVTEYWQSRCCLVFKTTPADKDKRLLMATFSNFAAIYPNHFLMHRGKGPFNKGPFNKGGLKISKKNVDVIIEWPL